MTWELLDKDFNLTLFTTLKGKKTNQPWAEDEKKPEKGCLNREKNQSGNRKCKDEPNGTFEEGYIDLCLCPPPPQIRMLKSNPQCGNIWRWALEETIRRRRAFMNGISVFVKETPGSLFAPSTMRGYSEKWQPMNQKVGSPQTANLPTP